MTLEWLGFSTLNKIFSHGRQNPKPKQVIRQESKNPCEYPQYLIKGWKKSKNLYTAQGTIKITGKRGGEIDIGKSDTVYFLRGHIQHDPLLDVGDAVIVRYHKYTNGGKYDFKACEVRRDPKTAARAGLSQSSAKENGFPAGSKVYPAPGQFIPGTERSKREFKCADFCINTKGRIVRISEPKGYGFIAAKMPVGFNLKSADVRPAKFKQKLTTGMVVYVDFNIDSYGKLFTEHIVALKEERLQGKTYSEGVVEFVNSRGCGKIMADVNIYYKMAMIPDAKLYDQVNIQAKIVAQGKLSAVSVSTNVSPTKTRHSSVSPRRVNSARSSPNRSPERYEKEKNSHETTAGRINKVQDGVVTISLFKEEGVSNKEFSMDKCEYANPDVGDIVNVEYERDEKGSCSRILRVQKILTKIGTVKNVGPVSGFIIVKTEQEDVYFERNCCQIAQPVEGDTVQVSYIHSCGKLKALHICDVETQSKDKDEGEQNQVSSSAKGNELPAGFKDLRNDVDHDGLSGEHLKIDKKDGNHSSHAGFEWRDFSELFSPIVTIQMQVENPTVSSDIVLNVLVETQVGQLWKHYQTGNYKMFVKSISPALKIKIAAENPGASSGAQKKIKMELIVKLWMLMGGNFGTC
mmetsp:Transcript_23283/g.39178  ORF Transcript_23283/g.39178 Transcript_23283/m.39178 type:complete len:632 (-) Transcript_23283:195-2090(-)